MDIGKNWDSTVALIEWIFADFLEPLEASFLHLAMNGEVSHCSPRTRSFLAGHGLYCYRVRTGEIGRLKRFGDALGWFSAMHKCSFSVGVLKKLQIK